MLNCPLVDQSCPVVLPTPVCPLVDQSCPVIADSCSRGHCGIPEEICDDCCDYEEEPVCNTCLSHRFDFAKSMDLAAPWDRRGRGDRDGRGGNRGLLTGGGLLGDGRGGGLLPNLVEGAVRGLVGGGRRGYPGYGYGAPNYFFPGRFPRRRWARAYLPRYNYWYPRITTPLYVSSPYGYMRNPQLSAYREYPDEIVLPTFALPENFAAYYEREDLSGDDQRVVARTLERINTAYQQLLNSLAQNPRYSYWTGRGFRVVPDLQQGRFVWVHSGALPNTTITEYMSKVKLSCAACGGYGGELKELAKLTHESIVFDVRGKQEDDIFKGFYISKDGHVFAYHIAHDHENPAASTSLEKTTVSELIPDKQVSPMEMERLIGLLSQLSDSTITHSRRHTGPVWYDGFINYKRIHIYGDDDSESPIADELVRSINAILA